MKQNGDINSPETSIVPEAVLDDGFYKLYSLPVPWEELRNEGVVVYAYPLGGGKFVAPDWCEFRILFGAVGVGSEREPCIMLESRLQGNCDSHWFSCDRNSETGYEALRRVLYRRLSVENRRRFEGIGARE